MANSFTVPRPLLHEAIRKSMVFHTPMYMGVAEGGGLRLQSDHPHLLLKVLCFHSPNGVLRSRRGGLLRPSACP